MTIPPHEPSLIQRRELLQMAAGLAALGPLAARFARAAATQPAATGKPGDFAFLTGSWKTRHRQLKADGTWDLFEGEATVLGLRRAGSWSGRGPEPAASGRKGKKP